MEPSPRWSITKRIIRSLMAVLTVLWIIGVTAAALSVHHELKEVFDGALRETTRQLIPIALHEFRSIQPPKVATADPATLEFMKTTRGHVHFLLLNDRGDVVLRSDGAPKDLAPVALKFGYKTSGDYRYYTRRIQRDNLWIQVAQEIKERNEAATGLLGGLASPLLALLPITAFAIWRTVGRAMRPVTVISQEIEARSGQRLDPIDDKGLPDELVPAVDSINTLMVRLKSALDAERAFAGNAAHELRNPIASARAQIQLLASNLGMSPERARAENISSQLGQLGRRIEKLLQISRAEADIGRARELTDLTAVTALLVDEFQRYPEFENRLRLTSYEDSPVGVAMDGDAIAIVIRNAIENALKHGSNERPVDVSINAADRSVRITNACALVPAETLANLKERFRRGTRADDSGAGLGLAIIDTIMLQAGGTVTLRSPAANQPDGFGISMRFPHPT